MDGDWGFPQLMELLQQRVDGPGHVFLVGGVVRDVLLGRSLHDWDFAVNGPACALARRVADDLGGKFYVMDEATDTARVLGQRADGQPYVLDFTRLRAETLAQDQALRDFTINALAVDVCAPDVILDPLGGTQDLKDGILRACSSLSLEMDPLRVVRGLRLAIALKLHIVPQTWAWMKAAAPKLERVSNERQRDELFRMLDGAQVASSIRLLERVGALPVLLPELCQLQGVQQRPPHVWDVWEHTLRLLERLEDLLAVLPGPHEANDLLLGLAVLKLGRFRAQLSAHFAQSPHPARSLRSLLMLAGLYHDVAKPQSLSVDAQGVRHFYDHDHLAQPLIETRARTLALSNDEIQRLVTLVGGHMRPHFLARDVATINRRVIYRYFRAMGAAGVELCLLALADVLAVWGPTLPEERWLAELDVCQKLLEAWWEQPEQVVHPPRLLNGQDLIRELHLQPGPQVGYLLEAVQEAQAMGEVRDRRAALELARRLATQA
jgi:tRNA nucleotidyltransferase/poly(A) polymerase